ncbi:MAG: hypothetical protein R3Y54_14020 [Eubacteriales bacterium]
MLNYAKSKGNILSESGEVGKDYTVPNLGHDNEKTQWLKNVEIAIRNRGIFMSGMLLIATDMDLKIEQGVETTYLEAWKDWKVSELYKKLMKEVFATDTIFSGYADVLQKMKNCLSDTEYNQVKTLFDQMSKYFDKLEYLEK